MVNLNNPPAEQPPEKDKPSSASSAKADKNESSEQSEKTNFEPLSDSEIKMMYSDPDKYKHRMVELSGKVFGNIEYTELGVLFQMFADPVNSELNTLVMCADKDIAFDVGDFVKLKGIVNGVREVENMAGAKLKLPLVQTASAEVISYKDAIAPTIHTFTPENNAQTQLGYTVTVEKVELAETETRVYLKVDNNGSSRFNLYSFNSKLVQNGKQYEEDNNFDAGYPKVQTDLVVGVSTEGVICFPPVENTDFQLIFEGRSENYEENFEPYVFEVAAG